MSSVLGRISGPLLKSNLERNGVNLAFETDLLYLDVVSGRVGIKTDSPDTDFRLLGDARATNIIVDNTTIVDNEITVSSNNITTTTVTPINIIPNQSNPLVTMDQMQSGNLKFSYNKIKNQNLNQNIELDPSGSGITEMFSSAAVNGDLTVTGNFQIDGNLSKQGNLIIGNSVIDDKVNVNTELSSSIIPQSSSTYDIGTNLLRWRNVYSPDNSTLGTLNYNQFTVGDQLQIDGNTASIYSLQSNDPVILSPDTGRTYLENFEIQDNRISNEVSGATFLNGHTGNGYLNFQGDNGLVIPAGTDAERGLSPEAGTTRWNTEQGYLEVYNGTDWTISTGPAGFIGPEEFSDLSFAYSLALG